MPYIYWGLLSSVKLSLSMPCTDWGLLSMTHSYRGFLPYCHVLIGVTAQNRSFIRACSQCHAFIRVSSLNAMCLLGLPLKATHLLRFPLDDMHLLGLLPPCHVLCFPLSVLCIYLGFLSQYHPCIHWGLLLITCNYWAFLSPCHESTWLCSPCPASLGVSPFLSAQWLKADEVEKGSSGTAIRIENPNQFVPLYTDPQEVLEMRNKVRCHPADPGCGVPRVPRTTGPRFPILSLHLSCRSVSRTARTSSLQGRSPSCWPV